MIHIVEIKARCLNQDHIRSILNKLGSDCKGVDHQIDTYFNVPTGRLKLRQGNIENALIFYRRPDQSGPKQSDVILHPTNETGTLLALLEATLGVYVRVDKKREIHYIDHVKFHLDEVRGLGTFVEIEAIDRHGIYDADQLLSDCRHYMQLFNIREEDLLEDSYSDQLIRTRNE
jgi:adenylate cyclase class 2